MIWDTKQVSSWLEQFSLPPVSLIFLPIICGCSRTQYFQEFMAAIITEDIDGVALLQLTPKDIKNLGLIQLGPRKRLESYIERINKGEKDEQVERLQDALKQLQGNLKDQAKTKTVRSYKKGNRLNRMNELQMPSSFTTISNNSCRNLLANFPDFSASCILISIDRAEEFEAIKLDCQCEWHA